MPEFTIRITPHDPIIARDGRPFGQGARMKSLPWIYPSVLAGSLRTMIGKRILNGRSVWNGVTDRLKSLEIAGPFLQSKNGLFIPAPNDCVFKKDCDSTHVVLRPKENLAQGWGCDLPTGLFPIAVEEDFKAAEEPQFWSMRKMREWLASVNGRPFEIDSSVDNGHSNRHVVSSVEQETRIHVKIDPASQTAEDGQLFETVGLRLCEDQTLCARVRTEDEEISDILSNLAEVHPFGGERRLAYWETASCEEEESWKGTQRSPTETSKIRMILTTPAKFKDGWRPGWIREDTLQGTPPGVDGISLKLVSAIVNRWAPISGWDFITGKPKPIHRLVPAGCVYFFQVIRGDAAVLSESLWMESVCDEQQDRIDGFGLSLWGVW